MKKIITLSLLSIMLFSCSLLSSRKKSDGWIRLFDGKSLKGWKANENPGTFKVENGAIVAAGPRSHLFYDGPVMNHKFKNFEFKAAVMTTAGSNSGIYFHTEFQDDGWPEKGYEAQINNSHTDWRRTGSLYFVQDKRESAARDNEWFTEHIIVKGKHITIKINDKIVVDYTEPQNVDRTAEFAERLISNGTFALQGHDPESKVYFKNIMVKILAD